MPVPRGRPRVRLRRRDRRARAHRRREPARGRRGRAAPDRGARAGAQRVHRGRRRAGAGRGRRGGARRRGSRSRACRSRSRATRRSRAGSSTTARASSPATGPITRPTSCGGCARPGFVIVGTTNLPEFGILPTTEPRHTGPTRNPWDLERTPGGSSGGAAAAVASGMLPIAHGNDGGGSIRIPAACCGLVGLKPSRGRVSRGPDLGDSWLACDGVLTRTVADTALALDVLGGYEVGDANWAPRPVEPYVTAMRRVPGQAAGRRDGRPTRSTRDVDDGGDPRAARRRGAAARRSATRSSRPRPRGRRRTSLDVFISVFGPAIALGIDAGVLRRGPRAGRGRDRAALARRSTSGRGRRPSVALPRRGGAAAGARAAGWSPSSPTTTCSSRPALAERPLPIGECNGLGEDPLKDLDRSGPLHALHVAVQRHRPARDLDPGRVRRRRAADRRADRRQAAVRGHAAAGRAADGGGAPVGAPAPVKRRLGPRGRGAASRRAPRRPLSRAR